MSISSQSPEMATIQLRKRPTSHKKEITSTEIPKILLKSRISHTDFPPDMQYPFVATLPEIYVDNGILSRNYVEALGIKKTRRRKFKPTEMVELPLETYTPFTSTEKSGQPDHNLVDKNTREKHPDVPSPNELHPLKIGKGKIPQETDDREQVHLKKTPSKAKIPEEKVIESKFPLKKSKLLPTQPVSYTHLTLPTIYSV